MIDDPKRYRAPDDLLDDRILLITGASDGIGRALSIAAAKLGARVILHGRDTAKLEAVYDEVEALPDAKRPSIAVLDLATADGDAYTALADSLASEFGRLDGLVHNASILGSRLPIEQYEPAEWQRVMHVNLTAPFVLTQMLLPMLKEGRRASVVFTSSGVGRIGKAFWGAYSVSKFGTEALSQILAAEQAHTELRFNCVNPGPVRTKMRRAAYPGEDPQTLKTPEDVLPVYLYLLGEDSRGVSGESLDCQ